MLRSVGIVLAAGAITALCVVLAGCNYSADQLISPQVSPDTSLSRNPVEAPLYYVGSETREEVLTSIGEAEGLVGYKFTDTEKQQILRDFQDSGKCKDVDVMKSTLGWLACVSHIADSWHCVGSGSTGDVWLEYKWNAGSLHTYYFQTSNWLVYWLIQRCYGGKVSSLSWMEGSYERVTAKLLHCALTPSLCASGEFIRTRLQLVSCS